MKDDKIAKKDSYFVNTCQYYNDRIEETDELEYTPESNTASA